MTESTRPAWLEGRSPALVGRLFDIGYGATRLGRSTACPVVITDPMISREHAEIRYASGTFTIVDLGSTHGTFVDGQPVRQAPLYDGALIRLGESEFTFHITQDAVPTSMVGAGAWPAVADPPSAPRPGAPPAPPRSPSLTPVAASWSPDAAPAAAPRKPGARRGWLIGCGIALLLSLCGCGLIVVLSSLGALPFGLDAAINRGLGSLSDAVSGDRTPYTREDLALALAMPTVDERPEILTNFGPPDEFEISIVQVEGGQVRREAWRYFGFGTRIDFVDGEIIWTIDLEPESALVVFPAWYDPTALETGMTIDEARQALIEASPADFVPEEIDLAEGGEDLAGGRMLVGDQIMLVFDQGVLAYAETFGVTLDEAAQ
ncbi:MAG: FHA domain-containing protein [Chloroflexi bacterium]|nr:FHA domain-containing protein [Chloroflexota bacterium]